MNDSAIAYNKYWFLILILIDVMNCSALISTNSYWIYFLDPFPIVVFSHIYLNISLKEDIFLEVDSFSGIGTIFNKLLPPQY